MSRKLSEVQDDIRKAGTGETHDGDEPPAPPEPKALTPKEMSENPSSIVNEGEGVDQQIMEEMASDDEAIQKDKSIFQPNK